MLRKLLFSISLIAVLVVAVTSAGTMAFMNDTEKSSGNTFAAGAIDLTVDSTQHMNQMICVDGFWQPEPGFTPPNGHRPVMGSECSGSWTLTDLGPTSRFFNLTDIRPGDEGESTISLHVGTNDAYACLVTSNLQNNDESITGPESTAGDNTLGTSMGELAERTYFFAWNDDGDNIWEDGETVITPEPVAGETFLDNQAYPVAIPPNQPLLGDTVNYIGLSWCVGTMTADENTHEIVCEPTGVGNILQTDSLKADITLEVAQSRSNPDFVCDPPVEEEAWLIVIKHVINDDGGEAVAADFTMNTSAGDGEFIASFPGVEDPGFIMKVPVGDYNVDETDLEGYEKIIDADCTGTIADGETKTCTIINNDINLVPRCQLEIVKQVDQTTANPGDTLTYTLNFENVGSLRCTGGGVKVEDIMDSKLTYVTDSENHSSNVSAGYHGPLISGQTIRWNAHELDPGESGWVSWQALINDNDCGPFEIPNQGKITATELNWEWIYSNTVITTGEGTNCPSDFSARSMGYWKTHSSEWILPQSLGSEVIATPEQATAIFNLDNSVMRNKLKKQLLALKFNIAVLGLGPLVPPTETITVNELAALADAMLDDGGATDTELEAMKDRVEAVNTTE